MCLQPFEFTSHALAGQATCPPLCNSIVNQTPAARLGSLLGQPVGLGRPSAPLQLKATWSMEDVFR